jgi:hypothetical protein
MNITEQLKAIRKIALTALGENSTLTWEGNSAACHRTSTVSRSRQVNEDGYDDGFDDLYVLVNEDYVDGWVLEPMVTLVDLDGVQYMTGRTVKNGGGYLKIYLRKLL